MPASYPKEFREKAVALADAVGMDEAARRMGCSVRRIFVWRHELRGTRPQPREPKRRKARALRPEVLTDLERRGFYT